MNQEHKYLVTLIASLAFASACNPPEESAAAQETQTVQAAPPPAAPENPAVEAKKVFSTRCAACHGNEGKGDGAGAAALDPKPRAFADAEWQKSVDDDYLKKVISEGGAAVGKSVAMPGHPDLTGKPDVLTELVKHIRAFAN